MHSIRAKGFTLVELMITIVVLAILTSIAFPSFQASLRSNRVATASNELMASLALARSEAIRGGRGGGVCASKKGEACDGNWNDGWVVWTDNNANRQFDPGEPVVRYIQAKQKLLLSSAATTLAFDTRGRLVAAAGQSIGVKSSDDQGPKRCVLIGPTGQVQIKKEACS